MTSPHGQFTYISAPNWPIPPTGWTPVEGWLPDPAWPPAPEGWVFWVPTDRAPAALPAALVRQEGAEYELSRDGASRPSPNASTGKPPVRSLAELAETPLPIAPAPVLPEPGQHHPRNPPKSFSEKRAEWSAARDLKSAAKHAAKQATSAILARQELLARRANLQEQLNFVAGWPGNAPASTSLVLKKGEFMIGTLESAGLLEVRRAPGHVAGGSRGVTVRVAKGVNIRAGAMRGQYVPGAEQQAQIDAGSASITNHRIVFSGSRQTREWKFENLLGRQLTGNQKLSWLELPVSNRQKMRASSGGGSS